MTSTPYKPTWGKYEKDIHSSDLDTALNASDAFEEERAKEMKNSKVARNWENDRKARTVKDKPQWRKERLAKIESKNPIHNIVKNLKNAGSFDTGLIPSPGYIIVEIENKEIKTETGLYIPNELTNTPNVGIVIASGGDHLLENGNTVQIPAQPGDRIMFKKGAGLEITLNEKECHFMRFDDVLGVFK